MKNEPIMIRALIGAILGLLVSFGVKLSGVQVESILALADAAIPLATALLGALSARSKVDGPETAKEKDGEIYRLQALLEKSISLEKPPPTPRSIGPVSLLLLVFGVACSGAQVREAATCSPRAQAWWVAEMSRVCGTQFSDECPESKRIDAEFLRRECLECARTDEEKAECQN